MLPSPDPSTDSVCVRVCHADAGGRRSTSRASDRNAPRSTVHDCGNALLALSQYVLALPSTALPETYTSVWLVSVVGRPAARLPTGGGGVGDPLSAYASNSDNWPAGQPVLPVNVSRR